VIGLASLVAAAALGAPAAADLTPAQLAGQRVVFAYDGPTPPGALVRRIERGEAAGVVLFSRNVRSRVHLRRTLAGLQRAARRSPVKAPLLVMVDQEGGPVRRVPGGPRRAAADVGRTATAEADGRTAGSALRAAGANVDLAPVADVCRPGSALERERRCYGRSAATVTQLAGGFARGLRSRGVAATLKHFPGFGAAGVNTDFSAQLIRTSLGRLRAIDVRPFARLAKSTPLVMLSTAVYPARSRRPAALAHPWATRELRGRLGFRGVSVTDALDTPATARFGGAGRLGVETARAGTDIALFARGYEPGSRAANALAAALRSGRLSRREFERSANRVLALRKGL
jgi:beta-N-acetylhexosaminidase